jgi:hypothetical protein
MTYSNNNLAIENSQENIQKTIFSNTGYMRGVYYQNGAVKFFKYQMILFYNKITFYEKDNFQIENSKNKIDRKEIKKIQNNSKNEYSSVKKKSYTNSKYLKKMLKIFSFLLYFVNNLLISFLKYTFQLIMMLIFAFGYAISFTISFAIKHFFDFINWASILFMRLLFYALGFVTYQAVCFGIKLFNIVVPYVIGMMVELTKFLIIIFK